jgi:hypothetical protein
VRQSHRIAALYLAGDLPFTALNAKGFADFAEQNGLFSVRT